MATTEELKVKITADASKAKAEIGKFKQNLKQTTSAAGDSTSKMTGLKNAISQMSGAASGSMSSLSGMSSSMGAMGVAVAAVSVAIKGFIALIKNAISVAKVGDEIKDNAQKVFMSTTAYQEWGYVLKQNGIEMSALKVGMRKFAQSVANGDEVLKKYGITATNVDDAFNQAISHIQNLTTETEKVAAATELFGTRALELFPILNLTNAETQGLMDTYRAIGGTMSNELIAMSDECYDSITMMKSAWGGLKNVLAANFLPTIIKVVQWLTVLIAKVRIVLAAIFGIKETFGGSNKKNSVAGAAASTAKSTGGTAKNLGKAAKKAKELKRTLMGIDELSRLVEQATASAGGGGGGGIGGVGGLGDIDAESLGELEGMFDSETLKKLNEFREKIEAIADKLHGTYLILQGIKDIVIWKNMSGGIDKILEGLVTMHPKLQAIKDIWDKIQSRKATVTLAISDKFSAGWKKVKGAWEKAKTKTAEVKLKFTEKLKSGWNAIAKKVQAARKKSAFARSLLPDMPLLARGGILTSPTAAIMGEYAGARQNPEIATPQSLMYETIQRANGDLVNAFATMTRQVIAAIENKDLSVSIGDEQVARSAQRGNTAYYNRTGRALLTI